MQSYLKKYVGIIRSFNRYYTNVLGLLNQHFLDSPYSLSEVRILHEIEKTEQCTASLLADTLSMDVGYLSRILKKFQKSGLIEKKKSAEDKRSQYLTVTPFGKENQDQFNDRSDHQIEKLVETLPEEEIKMLARNMTSIETILTKGKNIRRSDITIRDDVRPGDAGYLTYLHGWIYKKEYDYSVAFEGDVAESFYQFLVQYNPEKDRLWCAEHEGEIVGCIGIVGRGERAQLRWFLLHPNYRGMGLGKDLFELAMSFAREKGFEKVYLETTNDLTRAIGMYTKAGFIKTAEKENRAWRDDLLGLEFEMEI